jgi:hypothetical protein
MKTPEDFAPVEQENFILIEYLRTLYNTRMQDEQALQAIETRLAVSPGPKVQQSTLRQNSTNPLQIPKQTGIAFSSRPAARVITLLAAALVVVVLAGSFAIIASALHHSSSITGTSSVAGSGKTPSPQSSMNPQVSGTILEVHLDQSTSEGSLLVTGPKEQYHGFLDDKFQVLISKETRLFEQQQQGRYSVPLTRLQVGQHIQIQFDGSVMQSAPPQIRAGQLVIVSDS